jgi:hypothetical protein
MARRSLSMQGRILAAGVSVAVGGALVGFMAAGDHRAANASQSSTGSTSANSSTGASANSSSNDDGANDGSDFPAGSAGFQPQAQTRTGGS